MTKYYYKNIKLRLYQNQFTDIIINFKTNTKTTTTTFDCVVVTKQVKK